MSLLRNVLAVAVNYVAERVVAPQQSFLLVENEEDGTRRYEPLGAHYTKNNPPPAAKVTVDKIEQVARLTP